jgi:eukaryotic-like serine/threonine-protein kinase
MTRVLAAGALAALIAAMVAVALASLGSRGDGGSGKTEAAGTTTRPVTRTQPTTTAAPRPPVPIKLVAVGPYDPPPGDGTENDSQVPNAVDGNPATFWSTEHYTHGFFKPGVGIVLDAGKRRRIARVLVGTDEAGSRAEIQLADLPTGPYRVVSADKALAGTTAFPLKGGATGRYVLVWLTAVPSSTGEGHITEVRATAA